VTDPCAAGRCPTCDQDPPAGIVTQRAEVYGDPRPNHERIAALWAAWLGTPVTGHDVAWMFVLAKGSRSKANPGHGDNYVDAHGYLDIAEELQ
jgi:hypothetical protein